MASVFIFNTCFPWVGVCLPFSHTTSILDTFITAYCRAPSTFPIDKSTTFISECVHFSECSHASPHLIQYLFTFLSSKYRNLLILMNSKYVYERLSLRCQKSILLVNKTVVYISDITLSIQNSQHCGFLRLYFITISFLYCLTVIGWTFMKQNKFYKAGSFA